MPLNILIVDDDASFLKLIEIKLKSFLPDAVIIQCSSLKETRRLILEEAKICFDLVIIDENLPDGHGHEFLAEGHFQDQIVVTMSSDDTPELPGTALQSGATYFVSKHSLAQPLFAPLIIGLIDRNKLQRALAQAKIDAAKLETVKTLVATLQHEINNPLGAALGAAYLLKKAENVTADQREAAGLIESSAQRIKHVLEELCQAMALTPVSKAQQKVFHIPGDKPWQK
jgi:response regulator of citrate/malate metabolism